MQINSFLDLCSGIGGGRLGLEQAGMHSIGYCDTSRLAVTKGCSFMRIKHNDTKLL